MKYAAGLLLLLLAGCASAPPVAEAKVEGGSAKVQSESVNVKPSERREREVRIVIKGLPQGSVVVPTKESGK